MLFPELDDAYAEEDVDDTSRATWEAAEDDDDDDADKVVSPAIHAVNTPRMAPRELK